jgi:hypothetical protein
MKIPCVNHTLNNVRKVKYQKTMMNYNVTQYELK